MKTIIATTDFTPSSLNACLYAGMLAQKLNCKLTVFNLFDIPVVHSNSGLYFISFASQKKHSELKMKKFLTPSNHGYFFCEDVNNFFNIVYF